MVVDFDSTSSKTVSPVKLAHVVLRTQLENFQRMTSFYKTFLGGHASYENDVLSFITYDEEHHRIAIAGLPGVQGRNPKTCGLEVSIRSISVPTLVITIQRDLDESFHCWENNWESWCAIAKYNSTPHLPFPRWKNYS
jgi:catechol-2,3-dioxygenase